MRWVAAFAVLAVILLAFDNKLGWLAGVEFSNLFAYLIAVFFCLVLGYRVWDEYGRPKKTLLDQETKRVKRADQEKLFDELDAIEAKRAAQAGLIQATQTETTKTETTQTEPQLNQQPLQEEADVSHETQEPQEPTPSAVPVQLDLLGFSTKQK
jgi:hypothetical protein